MTTTIGVSLKMYFGLARALEYADAVAALAAHPAIADGRVRLFVVPGFLAVPGTVSRLAGTPVLVGAQDLATEDRGAFTGEVGGPELAEAGARVALIGHAERRRLFGETDDVVAAKTRAALRNGLTPVLCVGETERGTAEGAAAECVRQLRSALEGAGDGRLIVAYEPVWAIGAPEPATPEHIRAVGSLLRVEVASLTGRDGSVVVYGGSAGPGLLGTVRGGVDGLFLGRFAHDPAALRAVVDEAAA
jgi:triosephosphate isomerase